uniref:YopJ family acetyltransferase n=1 Tax=Ralstonia syzygii TaxID=28097 RepID=UPI003907EFD8
MPKTRISPATQPINTSATARPDTAAEGSTRSAHVSGSRPRTVDGSFRNLPTRHAGSRASKPPIILRKAPSKIDTRALAAMAHQPGLKARLVAMRQYLAELKTAAYANPDIRAETPGHRDAQFLDLLVAVENARHPKLALSAHTIDSAALEACNPAAVASLANHLEASMRSGDPWHAILSVHQHEMALSVRHHPEQHKQISIIVVDSAPEHLSVPEWNLVAALLAGHLDHKLAQAGDPKGVKIMLHCLNTATQHTNHGSAIFALSAVKAMPDDEDVGRLHEYALSEAGKHTDSVDVQVIKDNPLLGARFFKHMTHAFGIEPLLTARPNLRNLPVNKKSGLPLQNIRPSACVCISHCSMSRRNGARPTRTNGCSCMNAPSRISRRRACMPWPATWTNCTVPARAKPTCRRRAMPSFSTCWSKWKTSWTRNCGCPRTRSMSRNWRRTIPARSQAWRP